MFLVELVPIAIVTLCLVRLSRYDSSGVPAPKWSKILGYILLSIGLVLVVVLLSGGDFFSQEDHLILSYTMVGLLVAPFVGYGAYFLTFSPSRSSKWQKVAKVFGHLLIYYGVLSIGFMYLTQGGIQQLKGMAIVGFFSPLMVGIVLMFLGYVKIRPRKSNKEETLNLERTSEQKYDKSVKISDRATGDDNKRGERPTSYVSSLQASQFCAKPQESASAVDNSTPLFHQTEDPSETLPSQDLPYERMSNPSLGEIENRRSISVDCNSSEDTKDDSNVIDYLPFIVVCLSLVGSFVAIYFLSKMAISLDATYISSRTNNYKYRLVSRTSRDADERYVVSFESFLNDMNDDRKCEALYETLLDNKYELRKNRKIMPYLNEDSLNMDGMERLYDQCVEYSKLYDIIFRVSRTRFWNDMKDSGNRSRLYRTLTDKCGLEMDWDTFLRSYFPPKVWFVQDMYHIDNREALFNSIRDEGLQIEYERIYSYGSADVTSVATPPTVFQQGTKVLLIGSFVIIIVFVCMMVFLRKSSWTKKWRLRAIILIVFMGVVGVLILTNVSLPEYVNELSSSIYPLALYLPILTWIVCCILALLAPMKGKSISIRAKP